MKRGDRVICKEDGQWKKGTVVDNSSIKGIVVHLDGHDYATQYLEDSPNIKLIHSD